MVKRIYRSHFRRFKLFRSLSMLLKRGRYRLKHGRAQPTWRHTSLRKQSLGHICMAVICDDMTWMTLQGVCDLVYLTPENWQASLETYKPDVLFCESAWQGTEESGHCWEGQIPRSTEIWGDNRFVLKDILRYCKAAGIHTAFWNKEDPSSDHELYRFTDTAYLFDHICTTAEECISRYQAQGHKSVHLLPFGYAPRLFYPIEEPGEKHTAVFFGSWYQKFPQRCEDTVRLFDFVLELGMKLVIYDRSSGQDDPERRFPEQYQPYIRDAVPYTEIRNELEKYQYVLNLNTETQSGTMFARRVFEIMACGRMIISNHSAGMKRLFPDSVWYLDQPFDTGRADEYIAENQRTVSQYFTVTHHITQLLQDIGVLKIKEEIKEKK